MGIANCCEALDGDRKLKRTGSHLDNHSLESLFTL
jgi:hypothetical protein